MREVDGFERRRVAQLRGVEAALKLALLAGGPLGVDEQPEALLEAERGRLVWKRQEPSARARAQAASIRRFP